MESGGIPMSPKELLYIEDALGHVTFLQTKRRETAMQLQDAELKTQVEQMAQKQGELFAKFYSLV